MNGRNDAVEVGVSVVLVFSITHPDGDEWESRNSTTVPREQWALTLITGEPSPNCLSPDHHV